MIEFSEDMTKRYTGKIALRERVLHRLSIRYGEIPYQTIGIPYSEFTYNRELLPLTLKTLLSDLSADISIVGGRVVVGDISISIPEA